MSHAYVALGGNLGNVPDTFSAALRRLCENTQFSTVAVSRLYRTQPMGNPSAPAYWNAVAVLDCQREPLQILAEMQQVETEFGRVRHGRWDSRTIDLDLLAFGEQVIDSPQLTLPHPGTWWRRFVLDPWCDVAPDYLHPVFRQTVAELRTRLLARPLRLGIIESPGAEALTHQVADHLRSSFPRRVIDVTGDAERDLSFAFRPTEPGERIIPLTPNQNALEQATHILVAALDDPIPPKVSLKDS